MIGEKITRSTVHFETPTYPETRIPKRRVPDIFKERIAHLSINSLTSERSSNIVCTGPKKEDEWLLSNLKEIKGDVVLVRKGDIKSWDKSETVFRVCMVFDANIEILNKLANADLNLPDEVFYSSCGASPECFSSFMPCVFTISEPKPSNELGILARIKGIFFRS